MEQFLKCLLQCVLSLILTRHLLYPFSNVRRTLASWFSAWVKPTLKYPFTVIYHSRWCVSLSRVSMFCVTIFWKFAGPFEKLRKAMDPLKMYITQNFVYAIRRSIDLPKLIHGHSKSLWPCLEDPAVDCENHCFFLWHLANRSRLSQRAYGSSQTCPEGTVTKFCLPEWWMFRHYSFWERQVSSFSSQMWKNRSKLSKCGSQDQVTELRLWQQNSPSGYPLSPEKGELNALWERPF